MRTHSQRLDRAFTTYTLLTGLATVAASVIAICCVIIFVTLRHHHHASAALVRFTLYVILAFVALGLLARISGSRVDKHWDRAQNANIAAGLLPPRNRGYSRRHRLANFRTRRRLCARTRNRPARLSNT